MSGRDPLSSAQAVSMGNNLMRGVRRGLKTSRRLPDVTTPLLRQPTVEGGRQSAPETGLRLTRAGRPVLRSGRRAPGPGPGPRRAHQRCSTELPAGWPGGRPHDEGQVASSTRPRCRGSHRNTIPPPLHQLRIGDRLLALIASREAHRRTPTCPIRRVTNAGSTEI
ncbi:Uncharacterised protein [Mycobacteroides abscessus subsp. abscessus]|nr:Uncharacterised protein [Mycobacteroides abscessus subsp. abscessus]